MFIDGILRLKIKTCGLEATYHLELKMEFIHVAEYWIYFDPYIVFWIHEKNNNVEYVKGKTDFLCVNYDCVSQWKLVLDTCDKLKIVVK